MNRGQASFRCFLLKEKMPEFPEMDKSVSEDSYRKAFEELSALADRAEKSLDRARITLDAVAPLINLGEYSRARERIVCVGELLSLCRQNSSTLAEVQELQKLNFRREVLSAEIDAADSRIDEALREMNKLVKRYRVESKNSYLREEFDNLRSQLAFLLTNIGKFGEALPILEDIASRYAGQSAIIFYLGHCLFGLKEFVKARRYLEESINLGLPQNLQFQAHCSLGMTCYELKDYTRAKIELEAGVAGASKDYIREAHIWKWLEYTCISLGLTAEASQYAQMQKPS
jgi:tetratricopeptide (TPR) repeat protein